MPDIVAVVPADFRRWTEHIDRLFAESGREGQPLFSPYDGEWQDHERWAVLAGMH